MIKVCVPKKIIQATVTQSETQIVNSDIKLVKGDAGAVFTPHVDEFSNLSWTNDGGLENPPPRNIRGRDGDAIIHAMTNMEIEKIMEG